MSHEPLMIVCKVLGTHFPNSSIVQIPRFTQNTIFVFLSGFGILLFRVVSISVINKGSKVQHFRNSEMSKHVENDIESHPRALISHFKPTINHKNPIIRFNNSNKSPKSPILFYIVKRNISEAQRNLRNLVVLQPRDL